MNLSDRSQALHITKAGWDRITQRLEQKLLKDSIDQNIAIRRYLDESSKSITKGWENSLENVRKRKEEKRLKLLAEREEERQTKFSELRKEQEEIRAKYIEKVNKQIFMSKGYTRDLTSAFIMSEVLYERQKQQQFLQKIKQHEREEDLMYWNIVKEKDKEAEIAEEEKKKKRAEKEKKYGEELKKIANEKALLEKQALKNKVRREALENMEAAKEMEKMDKNQLEEKQRTKNNLTDEKKRYLQKLKDIKMKNVKEEKELDEVVQIYRDTKYKIDCMKQDQVQEMQNQAIKRSEKIAAMVIAGQTDRSEEAKKTIKKAIVENETAEITKLKVRAVFKEKMKQEQFKDREEMLTRQAEKKKKEHELRKWELQNRYQSNESMQKYEELKKKQHLNAVLAYRMDLLDQMEEQRQEKQQNKEIDEAMDIARTQEGHERFFQYADEVLELAKNKGRNTIPIQRVITRYIKDLNVKSDIMEKYGTKNGKT
ncbi:meiosis-specific nuclear structural protein 1-like [Euwallacea fornicatus]|uniref:meiosis-specific nuclear structural protein 1-like n=1 Tax=Euwallacea fornicatus TaxID=995702 RepID=UPI00338DCC72